MVYCTFIYALLWMSFSVHLLCAVTHTLQYLQTAVTPGLKFPEYTAVGLVDGEPFVYYDSNIRNYIPKTEWILKISEDDPEYWRSGTQIQQVEEKIYKQNVAPIMQRFNHTTGVHTLQRMYGCKTDEEDDGIIRRYDQLGYDGEDFLSLDLQYVTWVAAKPQAVVLKHQLDMTGAAAYDKLYLENICIQWLRLYVYYGRETLERKVPPEVSVFQKHSSPDVVCHVTGFYPKAVTISWQRDGEDLFEDVELGDTLPNQDGSFQKRSILKVPAEELQRHTYTCVVQHISLEEKMVKPVIILRGGGSRVLRIGIPAAGAVVAALGASLGIISIREKKSAFMQPVEIPSDEDSNNNQNNTNTHNTTNNGNNTNNTTTTTATPTTTTATPTTTTATPTTTTSPTTAPTSPTTAPTPATTTPPTTATTMATKATTPTTSTPTTPPPTATPTTATPTTATTPPTMATTATPTTATATTTNNGNNKTNTTNGNNTNNHHNTNTTGNNHHNNTNNDQTSDCFLTENESRQHNQHSSLQSRVIRSEFQPQQEVIRGLARGCP